MNCSKCGSPLHTGSVDGGPPTRVCLRCGPVGGTNAPARAENASPGSVGASVPIVSEGEELFAGVWADTYPQWLMVREYKFHKFREWRLDFAHLPSLVAVEMDSSAHRTKNRFAGDIGKHNALMDCGWVYFRTTRTMLKGDTERFLRMVAETIKRRL